MNIIDNKELEFLIRMVKESAEIIKNGKVEVKPKGKDDLVTNLDYEVEKYIISKIQKEYPEFDIVSEEFNSKKELTQNCFTIDPIDGTINFAHKLPFWAIQVSCIKNGETIVAVIYSPRTDELFYAVKNKGAFLNGERINISTLPLSKSLFTAHGHGENTKKVARIYKEMKGKTENYRRIGATSLSLAYVASGYLSGTVILNPTLWDVAPGMLLCKEAGAEIKTKFKNNEMTKNSEIDKEISQVSIIMGNKEFVDTISIILEKIM